MEKAKIVAEYCKLSATVAGQVFKCAHAADCFCGDFESRVGGLWNYQYEDAVLDYIREAVYERMKREGVEIKPAI